MNISSKPASVSCALGTGSMDEGEKGVSAGPGRSPDWSPMACMCTAVFNHCWLKVGSNSQMCEH